MLAFRNLKDIVKKAIQWETELKGFYEVAEVALRKPESRKLASLLREKLEDRLKILGELDVERHGAAEYVQFAAGVGADDLIRRNAITRTSTPDEILQSILRCDEALLEFYRAVAAKLVSRSQKDLFESLALFKTQQIDSIKSYMGSAP